MNLKGFNEVVDLAITVLRHTDDSDQMVGLTFMDALKFIQSFTGEQPFGDKVMKIKGQGTTLV